MDVGRQLIAFGIPVVVFFGVLMYFVLFYLKKMKRLKHELQEAHHQMQSLLKDLGVGVWSYDVKAVKVDFCSPEVERLLGSVPEGQTREYWLWNKLAPDVSKKEYSQATRERTYEFFVQNTDHIFRKVIHLFDSRPTIDYEMSVSGGAAKHIHSRIHGMFDEDGKVVRLIGIVFDITENVSRKEQIQFLANHDELTSLPNRRYFRRFLENELIAVGKENKRLALVFLDLDEFKQINDSYGHSAGDQLLIQVARRLQGLQRYPYFASRMGGDEFTVIISNIRSDAELADAVQQVADAFQHPFVIEGQTFEIRASLGVAVYPEHGDDLDSLMNHADTAMYIAKDAGKSIHYYQ